MMELQALPFYTIRKQDQKVSLADFIQVIVILFLIDGIFFCCCYGMASGFRVTVEFFNDGFLDVWLFMKRVGIEQRLGFSKGE